MLHNKDSEGDTCCAVKQSGEGADMGASEGQWVPWCGFVPTG